MEASDRPSNQVGPCSPHESGWLLDGPAAQRFWDKSAIGLPKPENKLLLTSAEVLFCSRHRHLVLEDGWLEQCLSNSTGLLHETAALEALRVPGGQIVLVENLKNLGINITPEPMTWGLRWGSSSRVKTEPALAEVCWVRSVTEINWSELHSWALGVTTKGLVAEVLIVDEEMGVTTYRIGAVEPKGKNTPIQDFLTDSTTDDLITDAAGGGFSTTLELPTQIGSPTQEGQWIDADELDLLTGNDDPDKSGGLLRDIIARGLLPRTGFKYGTKWRLYEGEVGEEHAPWLLQPEWLAPKDWAQACLSARLATGVHKTWICGFRVGDEWKYVSLTRPPPDSRWSGIRPK